MKSILVLGAGVLLFAGGIGASVLLERRDVFGTRRPAEVPQTDDAASLLVGKWQSEDGTIVEEYTADGRFCTPEVWKVDGKITSTKVTWGEYRFIGPRQVECKFRFQGLNNKPEFATQFTVNEITQDRLVATDKSGTVTKFQRFRE